MAPIIDAQKHRRNVSDLTKPVQRVAPPVGLQDVHRAPEPGQGLQDVALVRSVVRTAQKPGQAVLARPHPEDP